MATKALLHHGGIWLWLLAILAAENGAAQNLYIVGPGAVVMRQYRPGAAIYGLNTYSYVQTNPFISGPVTGPQVRIRPVPRARVAIPMDMGIATVSPNPYREYHTPHIPRYHRSRTKAKQPQAKQSEKDETQPIRQENAAETPATEDEQVSPHADEQMQQQETKMERRPRKPALRKPIRYR